MKTYKYFLFFSALMAVLISGCESLVVKNENDPDFATAFSKPSDVKGVAGGLINLWFNYSQAYEGPGLMLHVGADAGTCSHGNAGMRDFSYEPRIAWDNTPAYSNALNTETYYKQMYSLLSSSNEVLNKVVTEGMKVIADDGTDETPMVQAMAYLGQGLALGYVGLFFDKGFLVTETTDLAAVIPTSSYKELITAAVASLDKCIAVCESKTFTFPASWIPGMTYTQKEIGELANSFAASFLSYSPRNKTENNAVDWTKVLGYANKGLTYDFAPYVDMSWGQTLAGYDLWQYYATTSGWGRTDMRVVNLMDPAMPARWTLGAAQWAALPAPVTSHKAGVDDRIFTDFTYLSSCTFRVERGYYHYSCYKFKRLDAFGAVYPPIGNLPVFLKAENDLLKAEALINKASPDLAGAAAIINAGTRITRGNLATIGATAPEVEAAIWHERHVELFSTGLGIQFCFMRKADKVQPGSPLHFPIPGQQLEVNLMESYTFGPNLGTAGTDYSDGGWF